MSQDQRHNNNHRIAQLEALLQEQPNDCFLLHALGLEHVKLGDIDKAIELFECVVKTDETYVGTYYHLAKALELKGDKDAAVAVYNKGIGIAMSQRNTHTASELRSALEILTEDDD
ncbi:MAG: hypothetical protein RL660_22 [Bacteroidota bacterium]|jgi:uncharacterized protein HemY